MLFWKLKAYYIISFQIEQYEEDPTGKPLKKYPVMFYGTYETWVLYLVSWKKSAKRRLAGCFVEEKHYVDFAIIEYEDFLLVLK